jgi:hypothetical protein
MPRSPSFRLVELFRELDDTPMYGFVVAESAALLVIHRVSDRYDLDGYCAFPLGDVTSINESFKKRDLYQRAMQLKAQVPVALQEVELSSMRTLMESAQDGFGVLVISREKVEPGEVEVGTIRMTSEETYVLRWLTANADWENDDRPFRYRDITKLEFGSEYEQTLLAVARSRANDG